jgi:hypothetical protein
MTIVAMTRDSVCMADDVDAPHARSFALPDGADLAELARTLARSSYLPMPSDAWGWTIEARGVVVTARKGCLRWRVEAVRGDPTAVTLTGEVRLSALYVRPGSPWRDP